ncbi:GAF domain-containing protein [Sphingomonas trueperi]|uniref:GAF domain-containing protein n=1 Tax=Sphingomonas trueperi TaxID=53317 RepID=UPI003394BAAC
MTTRFFSPAPYPADEARRQHVVQMLVGQNLSTFEIQVAVDRAADIFGTRYAAMTILDHDRQWIAVSKGLKVSVMSRAAAFCGHTILSTDPLVVQDTTADERFAGNPLVLGSTNIQFYAGVPLVILGAAVGALCVLHDSAIDDVRTSQIDELKTLAGNLVHNLEAELGQSRSAGRPPSNVSQITSRLSNGNQDA